MADSLFEFAQGLREAGALLDAWSDGGTYGTRCREALEEAQRRAERLRFGGPELTYESLLAVIGELLDPLQEFEEVAVSISRR